MSVLEAGDERRCGGQVQDNISVQGVKVTPLTVLELDRRIAHNIWGKQRQLILNVNVHCINLCQRHEWLRSFINDAPIVFCDGSGVMLGARMLGRHIPERITYADWMWHLAEFAAEHDFSIYCLGARPGVVDQAVAEMRAVVPFLKIAGFHHGYFDKSPGSAENKSVVADINRAQPDILVVGFGMPVQEGWLRDNWDDLDVTIGLTGGAVFDYVSGTLRRAPKWILKLNQEWLGRLLIEPRRLARRYLVGNPLFMARIVLERLGLRSRCLPQ